ncbi:MAG: hypothetical protein ACYCXT_13600 [Acidiferrobacteraceae bacterium]
MEPPSSGTVWKYFPDPVKGINKTKVFIKAYVSTDIPDIEAAFRFLQDRCPSPLLLKKTSPDGLTVILEANRNPKIVFGRSVPTGDPEADAREIISVLAANGLQAKVV